MRRTGADTSLPRLLAVIPKSVTPSRIESNFKVVSLTDDEVAEINKIGEEKPARFNTPISYDPKWNINVFDTQEEKDAKHQVKTQ